MAKDPVCGMNVDEAKALRLTRGSETYYFCSKHCLLKFAKDAHIDNKELSICLVKPNTKWYQNKLLITVSALAMLVIFSYQFSILTPFRQTLVMYFQKIWFAVLLGLILGGVIDHFVAREYVSHVLSRPKKRTIFYSVILGFFMSACSHGILALSIELHKKGASNPAVVAFLLASPWANLPLTIMLVSLFGWKGLYIVISALIIALTTGFIYQFLDSKDLIERNKNIKTTREDFFIFEEIKKNFAAYKFNMETIKKDVKGVFSGSISLANMVLWWILIGIGLASLAGAYIPHDIFHKYMGPTAMGLFVTLALATVLEVCSEGTAPLAFEIYRQTLALGNAFVFLMAGVVTDYTEIGLLWFNVGKRVAIFLPLVTVPQVVALGILANKIF